ncbi:hypothetical protein D3C84_1157590 [compost metagenome]
MIKDAEKVFVLSNLTDATVKHLVPSTLKGNWKDAFTGAAVTVGAEITLQPFQYIVLKN